jgi:hypothetical protein
MLFLDKTIQIDATIANITTEIEELELRIERLRSEKLAAEQYRQQLGSCESAAESAIEQVRTAVTMIQAVSPDVLATFKQAIDALFTGSEALLEAENAPALPAAIDVDVTGEFPTDPTDPAPDSEDPAPTKTETVIDTLVNDGNGNGNGHHSPDNDLYRVMFDDLDRSTTAAQLRKALRDRSLSDKGKKSDLIDRLIEAGVTADTL